MENVTEFCEHLLVSISEVSVETFALKLLRYSSLCLSGLLVATMNE